MDVKPFGKIKVRSNHHVWPPPTSMITSQKRNYLSKRPWKISESNQYIWKWPPLWIMFVEFSIVYLPISDHSVIVWSLCSLYVLHDSEYKNFSWQDETTHIIWYKLHAINSPLIVSKPKTWLVAPQVLECQKLSLLLLTSFTSTSGYEARCMYAYIHPWIGRHVFEETVITIHSNSYQHEVWNEKTSHAKRFPSIELRVILCEKLRRFSLFSRHHFPWLYCVDFSVTS